MSLSETDKKKAIQKASLKISKLKKEVAHLKKIRQDDSLAIIGMGCTFPGGSNSPQEFWHNLLKGNDGICRVPKDRWDADAYFSKDISEPGKINSKRGGFIDINVANFDASFFGISPKEATSMDPQQRLLLEVTWQALENAAINPHSLKETSASVYIGSCLNDYQQLLNELGTKNDINAYMATGNSSSVMAGRIAYILGLEGPALSCDTACSSSLVAVHLACSALRNGETNLAIVGGVNLILSPNNSIVFSKANMLSEDGLCKTFDEKADGYVRGEGCGVVILKRLTDALKDNDNIKAVIKGSAINQDGASGGLTVPSISAQKKVMQLALDDAMLKPDDIDFIETHGTGTSLGDPIEIQSISHVYQNRQRDLVLGSVKVNIGHLEGAAGIAGLIKTVLALEHQQIPKHRNFTKLNPLINLDEIKGLIPLNTFKWHRNGKQPRRAGISSFGFSGSNAHLLVEEAPVPIKRRPSKRDKHLFCFSAKTKDSLQNYLTKFIHFLERPENAKLDVNDVSYALNTGRAQFHYRAVFFANSIQTLKERLSSMTSVAIESLQTNRQEEEMAKHFLLGETVDFSALYPTPCLKLALPTYAFQHEFYWEKSSEEKVSATNLENMAFFDATWMPLSNVSTLTLENKKVLVIEDHYELLNEVKKENREQLEGVLFIVHKTFDDFERLLTFIQKLIITKQALPLGLTVVTRGALCGPNRQSPHVPSYTHCYFIGLIKSLIWEAPYLNARLIDANDKHTISALKKGLPITASPVLSYDSGVYYLPKIKTLTPSEIQKTKPFNSKGTHWITGGTGSLGLALALTLINLGVRSIILSARKGKTSAVDQWLSQHKTSSVKITVVRADVTDKAQLKALIKEHVPTDMPLKGVYHLAGQNIQKPIVELNARQINEVSQVKAMGAKHLSDLTKGCDLNYFVLFSSIASFTGSNRQLPYVIGNTYLDSLAWQRREQNLPVLLINWGPWSQSTMIQEKMDDVGLIPTVVGLDCFTQLIQSNCSSAAVINPLFLPFMFSFFPDPNAKWLGDMVAFIHKEEPVLEIKQAETLLSLSLKERQKALIKLISEAVQETLELSTLPPKDEGFFDLGMDSLMSVDMGRKIQQRLGITIKPTAAFDYPTIASMADHLNELLTSSTSLTQKIMPPIAVNDSVAIIGMSCHFPGGADNLDKFWNCLREGKDCISEAPSSRSDIYSYIEQSQEPFKKKHLNRSGFINDIDLFDADFFNISPREAESLDPQQRLVLENAWKALEHAGIDPQSIKGKSVGIFIGISQSEYGSYVLKNAAHKTAYHATGTALNACAGRLAYALGTQGPTMAIDTACSSSLVAIHEACNSLKYNECELAIVAGVNALIDPTILATLLNAEMLSPDGACKSFDENANGYVRGEGCGVVVLQSSGRISKDTSPLAIIKASHMNQDGATSGLTVPNGVVQRNLISQTLEKAGLKPNDIDYIEAHGSGTSLGDPIEVGAISDVFSGRETPLIIGTVKTNIGHLESASGIAGLIKTVLSLQHEWLPKHLHLNKVNPYIDLASIPAVLPTQGMAFLRKESRIRRTGVSSFGFSGTNAHVIIEEPPLLAKPVIETARMPNKHLFVASAKSKKALQMLVESYIDYLNNTQNSLERICFTAACGRSHFSYRIAIISESIDELINQLLKIETIVSSKKEEPVLIQNLVINVVAEEYMAGQNIDWDYYYESNYSQLKKVMLPHYAFDKKRHWLDSSLEKQDLPINIHPLLQNQSYSHHHKEHLFTSSLTVHYPSFVKDHTIYELPVIAGATYVSMMISFVLQILEKNHGVINQLVFTQPLIVDKDKPRTLQLMVKELNTNESSFELLSYFGKTPTDYISHAQGVYKDTDALNERTSLSIETLKERLTKKYSGLEHQKNAAKAQLHLGPHFHWIDDVYYDDTELLAVMRAPTALEDNGYDLYPGLIDSSFQSMMAWIDFNNVDSNLPIPLSMDNISFKAIKHSPKFIHIKKNDDAQKINIQYFDAQGEEVLSIDGFTAREVAKETLLKILNVQYKTQAPTYFIDWQRASDNAFSVIETAVKGKCLQMISPARIGLSNLRKALLPMNTVVDKTPWSDTIAEHVIYVYPPKSKLGQTEDLYALHCQVKKLINSPVLKSLGVIINQTMSHSIISGYWKTLAQECTEKNIYLIESAVSYEEPLLSKLIMAQCLGSTNENHVAIRKGNFFVPRLLTEAAHMARTPVLAQPKTASVLTCENQLIDSLNWIKNQHRSLGENDVRIKISVTSLNFRDVLKLMGTYPGKSEWHYFEHAGIVTETGKGVNTVSIGDSVLTLAEKTLCSEAISDATKVIKIPEKLTAEQACSIPGVFLTAYGSLYELANLQKNQKVLIHAASGGVGLAAIQLAKLKGAIIYVTTSDPKRAYLKSLGIKHIYDSRQLGFADKILKDTNGKGVDVVLNSLTSVGFIDESLNALRKQGTFIEIGKINIFSVEKMAAVRPDVSYHIYALDERMALSPRKTARQLFEIFELHQKGDCQPIVSEFFDVRQVVQAFRYLQSGHHIGKVLIKHSHIFSYKKDKTYLISGGLGGLGHMLVKHLVAKGVKHVSLIGRRALCDLPQSMRMLAVDGVTITYHQADVSNELAMKRLVQSINQSLAPLAGVFHLAGLLRDKTIDNLSIEDFNEAFKAKVAGSVALHKATKTCELDCFVLFSSIACVFGAPGQANYAAANAFMDQLAKQRNQSGLAGLAINWGPFSEAGMAKDRIKHYQLKGLNPLDSMNSFRAMDTLLQTPFSQAMVADFDWQKASTLIHNKTLLSLVHESHKSKTIDLMAILEKAPMDKRADLLANELKKMVAAVLYIEDENDIDEHQGFFELGLDSLMSVDLWSRLQAMLGDKKQLSKTLLFEKNTIFKLCQHLQEEVYASLFQTEETEEELLKQLEALLDD